MAEFTYFIGIYIQNSLIALLRTTLNAIKTTLKWQEIYTKTANSV